MSNTINSEASSDKNVVFKDMYQLVAAEAFDHMDATLLGRFGGDADHRREICDGSLAFRNSYRQIIEGLCPANAQSVEDIKGVEIRIEEYNQDTRASVQLVLDERQQEENAELYRVRIVELHNEHLKIVETIHALLEPKGSDTPTVHVGDHEVQPGSITELTKENMKANYTDAMISRIHATGRGRLNNMEMQGYTDDNNTRINRVLNKFPAVARNIDDLSEFQNEMHAFFENLNEPVVDSSLEMDRYILEVFEYEFERMMSQLRVEFGVGVRKTEAPSTIMDSPEQTRDCYSAALDRFTARLSDSPSTLNPSDFFSEITDKSDDMTWTRYTGQQPQFISLSSGGSADHLPRERVNMGVAMPETGQCAEGHLIDGLMSGTEGYRAGSFVFPHAVSDDWAEVAIASGMSGTYFVRRMNKLPDDTRSKCRQYNYYSRVVAADTVCEGRLVPEVQTIVDELTAEFGGGGAAAPTLANIEHLLQVDNIRLLAIAERFDTAMGSNPARSRAELNVRFQTYISAIIHECLERLGISGDAMEEQVSTFFNSVDDRILELSEVGWERHNRVHSSVLHE
jgi:hypothetical protein